MFGRVMELARVRAALAAADGGAGQQLVIGGEPGSGKTAMLDAAVGLAVERGFRVSRVAGVEWERLLPLACLVDLFHTLGEPASHLLPVHGRAIASARGGSAAGADPLALGAATLALLAQAAQEVPLLLVVEDAHWVDPFSLKALAFAAHRLRHDRVAVLAATRVVPQELAGWPVVALAGLPVSAARLVLETAGKGAVPDRVVDDLTARTGGNPLALSELARVLGPRQLAGLDPLPEPLPIDSRLRDFYCAKLRTLRPEAQTAVAVGAAIGPRAGQFLTAALRHLGLSAADLADAETTDMVLIRGSAVEFRHPLMRDAALHALTPSARRRVHAAAAHACRDVDDERFAWHLENATIGTSETVAAAWERAAAHTRVLAAAAADAWEHAALTSPSGRRRQERVLRAAQAALTAGRPERCAALTTELLAREPSDLAAEVALLRGMAGIWAGREEDVDSALRRIAEEGEHALHQRLRAALLLVIRHQTRGDLAAAARWADMASELSGLAEPWHAPIRTLRAQGALLRGDRRTFWVLTGVPEPPSGAVPDEHIGQFAGIAQALCWAEAHEEAKLVAQSILETARRSAAVSLLAYPLSSLGEIYWRDGDWASARSVLDEAANVAALTDQTVLHGFVLALRARITAATGELESSRADITLAETIGKDTGVAPIAMYAGHAAGLLHIGLGEFDAAAAHLELVDALATRMSQAEPNVVPYAGDLGECWVRTGQHARAQALADRLTVYAAEQGSTWAAAMALRIRGMLDDDGYRETLERSLQLLATDHPFDAARTLLLLGDRLRRERHRREAREPLAQAVSQFAALGAVIWQQRGESLLRACGGLVPAAVPDSGAGLSAKELEVCRAVASGLSNREVAASLYVSTKTVEQHLTRSYAKLGVRGRSQLTRLAASGLLDRP